MPPWKVETPNPQKNKPVDQRDRTETIQRRRWQGNLSADLAGPLGRKAVFSFMLTTARRSMSLKRRRSFSNLAEARARWRRVGGRHAAADMWVFGPMMLPCRVQECLQTTLHNSPYNNSDSFGPTMGGNPCCLGRSGRLDLHLGAVVSVPKTIWVTLTLV